MFDGKRSSYRGFYRLHTPGNSTNTVLSVLLGAIRVFVVKWHLISTLPARCRIDRAGRSLVVKYRYIERAHTAFTTQVPTCPGAQGTAWLGPMKVPTQATQNSTGALDSARRASTAFCYRSGAMRGKAKMVVPPLQQADFDALPHSVQRKYFSSLERLQIRQHSLDSQHASTPSLSSHASSFCPSLTLGTQRRTRKSEVVLPGLDVSQAQVHFFLSLPTKLRRLYYSPEEQTALLANCQSPLFAFDYDFERARQRFDDFQFDFKKRDPDSISQLSFLQPEDRLSVNPGGPSFGPLDQEHQPSTDSQSSIFCLDIMAPSFPKNATPRANVRRTMSLSTSSGYYSSASAVLMAPSGFAIAPAAPTHQRAHSSTPISPVFDSEAAHYRDPEARKKLRTYLASPQKFDEAIEFGFPSNADDNSATPHYQLPPIASHSRKFSKDMHTFLREGKLSFFEDHRNENQGLDSDRDSVPDMESPTTPSSTGLSFRLHSRRVSQSKLSTDESPALSPTGGHLNREMTLRMTLTRPDLRADDDQLYGWQSSSSPKVSKDDPLALEDLVFTDDMTGTQGAFYVKPKPRGNLVTRMLKRASLKGR
ncbi:hypothetical protein GQ44DRAFT_721139 [Phaeosphaeriaceae sp. PMI808]|nr:hypothetical protein GQ44DRAFT_721139 [Phaeosphaeriaceae sp. PMI808]